MSSWGGETFHRQLREYHSWVLDIIVGIKRYIATNNMHEAALKIVPR